MKVTFLLLDWSWSPFWPFLYFLYFLYIFFSPSFCLLQSWFLWRKKTKKNVFHKPSIKEISEVQIDHFFAYCVLSEFSVYLFSSFFLYFRADSFDLKKYKKWIKKNLFLKLSIKWISEVQINNFFAVSVYLFSFSFSLLQSSFLWRKKINK